MDNSSPYQRAQTPPESPCSSHSHQLISLQDIQKLLVEVQNAAPKLPDNTTPSNTLDNNPLAALNKPRVRASKLEYKNIDETWNAKEYKYNVTDSAERTKDVTELDEYVFVARKRVDRYTLETSTFIDVKSESLRDTLRILLGKVRGLDLRDDNLCIERNVLFHFLDDLRAHHNKDKSTAQNAATPHLGLLLDYMEIANKPIKVHLTELLKHQEITYALLWALFPPNALLYTTCRGTKKPRCVRYDFGHEEKLENGTEYFKLKCRYHDFDGSIFGDVSTELAILKFQGTEPIRNLPVFPLQYHPDESEITARLESCGRKFVSLLGGYHRHCRGSAFFMEDGKAFQVSVNSRVMVDAIFFRKMNPNYTRPHVVETRKPRSLFLGLNEKDSPRADGVIRNGKQPSELEEDELLICCPTVPGFSFGDKLWLEFPVEDIEDIKWSPATFDSLTIAKNKKEIILAMASVRVGQSVYHGFDDVVVGKGQGLNILLHGPPGVGKTLTAEGVAEYLQKPLYSISAGELEVDSRQLEKRLSSIFQMAQQWKAILLLDEADVFLEQRSSAHLLRNSLVSVFLRKLEYCSAVLFLTTNRVSEFDNAILSRIHLSLKYGNLGMQDRRVVWLDTLSRASTSYGRTPAGKELESLARVELNGRQIKNVVAAAHSLATQNKVPLSYHHIQQALAVNKEFIDEFYGIPERLYT